MNKSLLKQAIESDHIVTIPEILRFFKVMEGMMTIAYDTQNMEQLKEILRDVSSQHEYSGKVLSSAKWHYNKQYNNQYQIAYQQLLNKKKNNITSASILKKFLESTCADYVFLVDRADRLNSSMTHYMSSLVTQISEIKNYRSMVKFGGGGNSESTLNFDKAKQQT